MVGHRRGPPTGPGQRDVGGRREELPGVLRDDRLVEDPAKRRLRVELKSREYMRTSHFRACMVKEWIC